MDSRARAASANLCHSNGDGTARSSRSQRKPGSSNKEEKTEQSGVTLLRISSMPNEARIFSSNGHNREPFHGKTKSKRSSCDHSSRYSSASNSSDASSPQFTNSGHRSPGEFSNDNESNNLPEFHSDLPKVTKTPCRSILARTDISCKGEKDIECEEIGDGIRCKLPSSRGHGTVTVELKKGNKDPAPCSGTMLQFRIRGQGKPQHKSETDKAIQVSDYPEEAQRDFLREDAYRAAEGGEQSGEFLWEPVGEKKRKPRPKPRFQNVVGISTCGKHNHRNVSSPAKKLRPKQERNKKQGKIDWCDPLIGRAGYEQGVIHQVRDKHRKEGQTADLDDNLLETLEEMFNEMSEYGGLTQPDKQKKYTVDRTMRPVSPDTMKIIKEVEKMDVLDSISGHELDRELKRELNNPPTITIPVQDDRKPPTDPVPKLTSQSVDCTNTWQPILGPPQQASQQLPYQSTQLSPHQLVQQPPNAYVNTQLAVRFIQLKKRLLLCIVIDLMLSDHPCSIPVFLLVTRTLSKQTQNMTATVKLAPPKIPAFFAVRLGSSEVGLIKNQDVCRLEPLSTADGTVPVALMRACLEQVTLLCPKWSTLSLEQRQRFAVNEQLAWLQQCVKYISTKFKCAEDIFDLDCSSFNADEEIDTLDQFIYHLFQHLQKLGCRFSEYTNSVLYRTTLLCLQTILQCALERLKHIHQRSTERPASSLIHQSVGLAKDDSACSTTRNEQQADAVTFDPTITDSYLPTVPAELVSVKISSTQHINSDETELKSTNPASSNPFTSIPPKDQGTQTSWIPSFSITSEEKRLELSTLDPHVSLMTSSSIPILCGPAEHMKHIQHVDSIDKMTKPWEQDERCTSVELLFTTANMRPSLVDRSDEDRPTSEQSSRMYATQRSSSIPRSPNRNAYYYLTFVPPNSKYGFDGMQELTDLPALKAGSPTDRCHETQDVAFMQKTGAAKLMTTCGDTELGSTTDKENQLDRTSSMTVHKRLVGKILALTHKGLTLYGKTVIPLVTLGEDQKICHQVEHLLDHTMATSLTKRMNELCEGTSSMQLSQIVTSAPINIELLMAKKLLELIPDVNFYYSNETIPEGPGEARVFTLLHQIVQTVSVNQTQGNSSDGVASNVAKNLSRGLLGLAYSASCYAMDHLLETKVDTELRTCARQQGWKYGLEGSRLISSSTYSDSQPTTMQTIVTSNVSPVQGPFKGPNSSITVQRDSHLSEAIRPSTAMKEQELSKKGNGAESSYSVMSYCARNLNSQDLEQRVAEAVNPRNECLSPTKFHLPAEEQRCVVVSCTDRNCFSPQPLTQHGPHSTEQRAQHLLSAQRSPSEYASNNENDGSPSLSSTYTEPQADASMKEVTVGKDNMCVHMTFSVTALKDTTQCVLRPLTIKTRSGNSKKETYTRLTSNDKNEIVFCEACSQQLRPYLYRQLEDGASVDNPFGIEVGIQCNRFSSRSRSRQNRSRSSVNRSAGSSSRFNLTAMSMDDPGRMDPPTLSACVSAIHVSLNEDNENDNICSTDGSGRSSDDDDAHFMRNRHVRHRGFRTDEVTSTSSVIYRSVSVSVQEIQGNQDRVARELRVYPNWLTDKLKKIDVSEDTWVRSRRLTRGTEVPSISKPRPKGDTLLQEKSLCAKKQTGQKTKLYWQSRKEQTASIRGDGGCRHSGRSRFNYSAEHASYPDDFSVPKQTFVGQKKSADPTEPFYSCLQELKKCLREAESRLKTVHNYSGQSIKITRTRPRIVPRQTSKKPVGIEARQKTHRGKPERLKQWPTLPDDSNYDASALGGSSGGGGESTTCDRLPTCSERTAPTSSHKQASTMKTEQKEDVPSARQLRKSCFRSTLHHSIGPPSTARWTVDDIRSRGPKFFPAPSMELPVRGTSNEPRIPVGTQMSNCLLYVKHQGNKPLCGPLISGQYTLHNTLSRSSFGQTSNMAAQNTPRLCKKVAHRME
ncbi:hypothetical protein T265_02763 [Opisthorchis viverrini]|uniref:Uncharacterized protein n=1 Tax=Opisthorchis viverrini TaxID=6198 RepID=A0A075AI37_OPIVI|nr:hypothetical protein T265_02763 [Opisthorchis viverrini]KER30954.1 hypothetical protein T265_02763 [Opisthorchis viverrini]